MDQESEQNRILTPEEIRDNYLQQNGETLERSPSPTLLNGELPENVSLENYIKGLCVNSQFCKRIVEKHKRNRRRLLHSRPYTDSTLLLVTLVENLQKRHKEFESIILEKKHRLALQTKNVQNYEVNRINYVRWTQDSFSCAICYGYICLPIALGCGHIYCFGCIENLEKLAKEKSDADNQILQEASRARPSLNNSFIMQSPKYECPQCRGKYDPNRKLKLRGIVYPLDCIVKSTFIEVQEDYFENRKKHEINYFRWSNVE